MSKQRCMINSLNGNLNVLHNLSYAELKNDTFFLILCGLNYYSVSTFLAFNIYLKLALCTKIDNITKSSKDIFLSSLEFLFSFFPIAGLGLSFAADFLYLSGCPVTNLSMQVVQVVCVLFKFFKWSSSIAFLKWSVVKKKKKVSPSTRRNSGNKVHSALCTPVIIPSPH